MVDRSRYAAAWSVGPPGGLARWAVIRAIEAASVAGLSPAEGVRRGRQPAAGLLDRDDGLVQPAPGDVGHDHDHRPAVGRQLGLRGAQLVERRSDGRGDLALRLDRASSRPCARPCRTRRCDRSSWSGCRRRSSSRGGRAAGATGPAPRRPCRERRAPSGTGTCDRAWPPPAACCVVLGQARRQVDRGDAAGGQRRPRLGQPVGRRQRRRQAVVADAQARPDPGRVIGSDPRDRREARPERLGRFADRGQLRLAVGDRRSAGRPCRGRPAWSAPGGRSRRACPRHRQRRRARRSPPTSSGSRAWSVVQVSSGRAPATGGRLVALTIPAPPSARSSARATQPAAAATRRSWALRGGVTDSGGDGSGVIRSSEAGAGRRRPCGAEDSPGRARCRAR